MHGLTDIVVTTERERQVTDAATNMGARQVLMNPTRCTDEVGSIAIMLLHTGSNSQHIGVKDNIERIHTNALGQNTICTFGYLDTAFIARGLPLFIKAHHNNGCAIAHTVESMTDEDFLALLQ